MTDDLVNKKLKEVVSKEFDHKETVSFNFPKYQEIGTPHSVWERNVDNVEKVLEEILSSQPLADDFPLVHIRREEKDEEDSLIRVHLDVYGKATLVKFAVHLLKLAENLYVTINNISAQSGEEHQDYVNVLLDNFQAINSGEPESLGKLGIQTINYLEKIGVDVKDVKLSISNGSYDADSATNMVTDSDIDGPLSFESDEGVSNLLVMPNYNIDDVN